MGLIHSNFNSDYFFVPFIFHTRMTKRGRSNTLDQCMDEKKMYYKVMDKSLCHHGYQYKIGLNHLIQGYNTDECTDGGFYICGLSNIHLWFDLHPDGLLDAVAVDAEGVDDAVLLGLAG